MFISKSTKEIELNKRLQVALILRGKTQSEIAEKIGTSQPHVSDWLNGIRLPTSNNLMKLADALEISPIQLVSYLEEMSRM
jgi:transcriptional regulator with XRE-family HTH domain